jgi:hypothetical protein
MTIGLILLEPYAVWFRIVMFVLLSALLSDDRFWVAASRQFPQKLWVSSTGDYGDMNTGDEDDDSFDREIASEGLNAITWLATARDLVIGTINEEFVTLGYPCWGLHGEDTPSPQLKSIVVTVQFVMPALNTL